MNTEGRKIETEELVEPMSSCKTFVTEAYRIMVDGKTTVRPFDTVTRQNEIAVAIQSCQHISEQQPKIFESHGNWCEADRSGRTPWISVGQAKTANAYYILCSLTKLHRKTVSTQLVDGGASGHYVRLANDECR